MAGLPLLEEEEFSKQLALLEDAMYSLDGGKMLEIIEKLQQFQYHQAVLEAELAPVKKKIEMSDYMSALDAVTQIRERLQKAAGGGAEEP